MSTKFHLHVTYALGPPTMIRRPPTALGLTKQDVEDMRRNMEENKAKSVKKSNHDARAPSAHTPSAPTVTRADHSEGDVFGRR